jgi:7-cyano-7-deazaguanine synthase
MSLFGAASRRCGGASFFGCMMIKTFRTNKETPQTSAAYTYVLLSGGLDSATLLAHLLKSSRRVRPVFVGYGQAAINQERRAARDIAAHYGRKLVYLDFSIPGRSLPAGEIPGRNALLVFAATMLIRDRRALVAIGIHSGTSYSGCTPAFIEHCQSLLGLSTEGRFRVVAPFIEWTKLQIYQYAKNLEVPTENTYSCERGLASPCGRCLSCHDRRLLECNKQ